MFGDVSGSTLTVDNSIHKIEQAIEENGGTDKEDLYEILNDVKELIENIQTSRTIPKQKKLFERISDHMEKHGWFYGAVVQLLGTAADQQIDEDAYSHLKQDLSTAERFVFFTDNCGEVVLDKLLIEEIQRQYPQVSVSIVVRGAETLNDVPRMDAAQVGLGEIAYVVDNGNDVAGTWVPELSEEALARMESADVMLAKGQANFETMRCCGKNIYYLFLCKCHIFSDMFGVEPFSGMLVRERDARNR